MRTVIKSILQAFIVACAITALFGCAHDLEAKYGGGAGLGYSLVRDCPRSQLVLGVRFAEVKDKYEQALSESIVDALGHAGCFSRIIQNLGMHLTQVPTIYSIFGYGRLPDYFA